MGSEISFGRKCRLPVTCYPARQNIEQSCVCKMPGEGFPALKDANMQEALNSHAAELIEGDPEQ
jgi:hypothetical protein